MNAPTLIGAGVGGFAGYELGKTSHPLLGTALGAAGGGFLGYELNKHYGGVRYY